MPNFDRMYFVKTPEWLKKLFHRYIWSFSEEEKVLYLTFDDGPHPVATPFVLNELDRYGAKASFFSLGKNVRDYPDIYARILTRGHTVGNHTYNHLNNWKVDSGIYMKNVQEASMLIESRLFRPPYGRITRKTGRMLLNQGYKVIMWDVLSGDFDIHLSPQNCEKNVTEHAGRGSIVVFHDSEKAYPNLQYALPRVLEFFSKKGYSFQAINPLSIE